MLLTVMVVSALLPGKSGYFVHLGGVVVLSWSPRFLN